MNSATTNANSTADTAADQANAVRREVSGTYAEAVSKPTPRGCGCGLPRKGALVELSGYSRDDLSTLPAEAVTNSFGCGDPVAFAGLREGDAVLDLGSGAGIDLLLAARKVGAKGHVIGVDMTDAMIAKARENISQSKLANVEVRKGIIEELPVETASIDWVISNCVINLSPEKPKVFREIARVLKPGGQMLVSDIVVKDLPAELRNLPIVYNSCIGGAISEEQYLAGLHEAGLVDAEVRGRLVYDANQLCGVAESALAENPSLRGQECSCPDASALKSKLRGYAESLAGKIWSAKVYARKPA